MLGEEVVNMLLRDADDKCYFCKRPYYIVAEQKAAGVVFCPNPEGRIACKSCWDNFAETLRGLLKYLNVNDIVVEQLERVEEAKHGKTTFDSNIN